GGDLVLLRRQGRLRRHAPHLLARAAHQARAPQGADRGRQGRRAGVRCPGRGRPRRRRRAAPDGRVRTQVPRGLVALRGQVPRRLQERRARPRPLHPAVMDPEKASLTGRTAVVTGAGAGIGKGIALGLAAFGARVAVLELDAATAYATAAEIEGAGGQALALPADVRDGEAVERAVAATVERFGGIDVLVNNVGGTFRAAFLETGEKGWDALVRANLKTVLHGTRAVAPRMIARGRGGSIVNIVSIEGGRAAPFYAVYAACKAAVIGFTQSMALELAPHAIRVNAIAPDLCLTEGLAKLAGEAERERHRFLVPLGRAGVLDDGRERALVGVGGDPALPAHVGARQLAERQRDPQRSPGERVHAVEPVGEPARARLEHDHLEPREAVEGRMEEEGREG